MILQDDNVSDEIKGIIKASTDEVAPSEELKTVFIGCQVAKTIDASVHITNNQLENQDLDYMPSPSPTNNEQKRKHVMTLGEWKISADKEPWDHDGMNLSSKFYEFHIAAKKRYTTFEPVCTILNTMHI
ncbi:hypothetical protein MFLAVUS_002001 [Mucor flavus]|uniref:Uncharacterized protein n=1 Tax=Mucor flavus TaxID=439312 RepID=A0ABP9YP32_9FUNG